jgi:hypothetical protein
MFAHPALIDVPFFAAGLIKISYDLLLYWGMASVHVPELAGSNVQS